MKGAKPRLFKLATPLSIKRSNSHVIIDDGFFSYSVALEEWGEIELKSIDSDGFIAFQIHYLKPERKVLASQVEATINGYHLFHSSVPKAKAYGTVQSVYNYYKRTQDSSYYVLIKREGSKDKKLNLGSLLDVDSRIYQMVLIIKESFDSKVFFDRRKVSKFLPSPLRNRRIMKAGLDILTAEGFFEKRETKLKGHLHEEFRKTQKLEKFMFDPRSLLEPSGISLGQVQLTSDR